MLVAATRPDRIGPTPPAAFENDRTGHPVARTKEMPSMPADPLSPAVTRRTALGTALAAAGAAALGGPAPAAEPEAKPDPRRAAPKRYDMKKSINIWAFPYPDRMTL